MIVLTASTKDFSQLTDIQKQSCILNGIAPNEHVVERIPQGYEKHPSWFRIRALLDHLPNHDMVLWLDSDAMLLRPLPAFPGKHMLYVARDFNGLNHGVACYRNTPKTREFLWRVYDSHWRFRSHPWHEQGAIHTIAEQYDIHYMEKDVFNCYMPERTSRTSILHLPAKSFDDRLSIMTGELLKLQKRP